MQRTRKNVWTQPVKHENAAQSVFSPLMARVGGADYRACIRRRNDGATECSNWYSTARRSHLAANANYWLSDRDIQSGGPKLNLFTRWYYGNDTSADWCAIFLSYVFAHSAMALNNLQGNRNGSAFASDFGNGKVFKAGFKYDDWKPGAPVYVGDILWQSTNGGHVGMVTKVSGNQVWVTEGNWGGEPDHAHVKQKGPETVGQQIPDGHSWQRIAHTPTLYLWPT